MEKTLVAAAFQSREGLALLPDNLELTSTARQLIEMARAYYDADPAAQSCNKDVVAMRIQATFQNDADIDNAWNYLESLPKVVSLPNLVEDCKTFQKQSLLIKLKNACVVGTEHEIQQAIEVYQNFEVGQVEQEQIYRKVSIVDLVKNSFSEEGTIKLWPKKLNELCGGGVRPGHHIVIYGRPEMGKTLITQNMVAGFLRQKLLTLYIGNEDPAADLLLRQCARLIKRPRTWVKANPEEAEALAKEKGYDYLVVAELAPGNFQQIRRLVEKDKPKVVVLDQLRNLDVNSEGKTQQLEEAATQARNLAKRYKALVISVTQAGDSAEGKALLGRSDVDSSKTGIPGTADLMVGVGADAISEKTGFRTINLPKNKISGRHESFTFSVDTDTGEVLNA